MTITRTLLGSVAGALVAALSIAASTASATTQPLPVTAGLGCSVQCISKAAVTVTASSAKVELATTTPANLKVTVRKAAAGGNGGLVAAQAAKTVLVPALSPSKVAVFTGLEPATTYRIVVYATDLYRRSSSRSGTFKTLPIKTTMPGGPDTIDSGIGCSQQCITKALVGQKPPDGTSAKFDIATSTTAHIQIEVSRAAGSGIDALVVSHLSSSVSTKAWAPTVSGLDYGTKYDVVVRARDSQGRVSMRKGSFHTVSATATIMLHRIKVLNDGDKRNKGELFFRLWLHDSPLAAWGTGLRALNSGDTTNVNPPGTSRPGFAFQVTANGDAEFSMEMTADECDKAKSNCVVRRDHKRNFDDWASAGGRFDVSQLLKPGAHPGWHGTGVSEPAGHHGYFVFGTTNRYVKFLVLATIDLHVDWP